MALTTSVNVDSESDSQQTHKISALSLVFFDISGKMLPLTEILFWYLLLPLHFIISIYNYLFEVSFNEAFLPSTLPVYNGEFNQNEQSFKINELLNDASAEAKLWHQYTVAHTIWKKQCVEINNYNNRLLSYLRTPKPLPEEPRPPSKPSPLVSNTRHILSLMRQKQQEEQSKQQYSYKKQKSETSTTYNSTPENVLSYNSIIDTSTVHIISILITLLGLRFFMHLAFDPSTRYICLWVILLLYVCLPLVYFYILGVIVGPVKYLKIKSF